MCGTGTNGGDVCNAVTGTANGPCVDTTVASTAAPTPAGGAIADGTYVLTADVVYGLAADAGDPQANVRRETWIISNVNAGMLTLDQIQVSGTAKDTSQGTVTFAGMTVSYTQTCPAPGDGGDQGGMGKYTATATTFTLFTNELGGTRVRTYTKQ